MRRDTSPKGGQKAVQTVFCHIEGSALTQQTLETDLSSMWQPSVASQQNQAIMMASDRGSPVSWGRAPFGLSGTGAQYGVVVAKVREQDDVPTGQWHWQQKPGSCVVNGQHQQWRMESTTSTLVTARLDFMAKPTAIPLKQRGEWHQREVQEGFISWGGVDKIPKSYLGKDRAVDWSWRYFCHTAVVTHSLRTLCLGRTYYTGAGKTVLKAMFFKSLKFTISGLTWCCRENHQPSLNK